VQDPAAPTGHTFLGWRLITPGHPNSGQRLSSEEVSADPYSSMAEFVAEWSISDSIRITFEDGFGNTLFHRDIARGMTIDTSYQVQFISNPSLDDHTFMHWESNNWPGDFRTSNQINGIVFNNNTTIRAVWGADSPSQITFEDELHGASATFTRVIAQNQSISTTFNQTLVTNLPNTPHYTFGGWRHGVTTMSSDAVNQEAFPGPTTLKAIWTITDPVHLSVENLFGVTRQIQVARGLAIDSTFITMDSPVVDPSQTGYTFVGWESDAWNNATIETHILNSFIFGAGFTDVTISAVWEIDAANALTITIEDGFGNVLGTRTVVSGQSINLTFGILPLSDLTQTGHTFIGWNTEEFQTTGIPTDEMNDKVFTENTTIYAVWEFANTVAVTLQYTGGEPTNGEDDTYGTIALPSGITFKEAYRPALDATASNEVMRALFTDPEIELDGDLNPIEVFKLHLNRSLHRFSSFKNGGTIIRDIEELREYTTFAGPTTITVAWDVENPIVINIDFAGGTSTVSADILETEGFILAGIGTVLEQGYPNSIYPDARMPNIDTMVGFLYGEWNVQKTHYDFLGFTSPAWDGGIKDISEVLTHTWTDYNATQLDPEAPLMITVTAVWEVNVPPLGAGTQNIAFGEAVFIPNGQQVYWGIANGATLFGTLTPNSGGALAGGTTSWGSNPAAHMLLVAVTGGIVITRTGGSDLYMRLSNYDLVAAGNIEWTIPQPMSGEPPEAVDTLEVNESLYIRNGVSFRINGAGTTFSVAREAVSSSNAAFTATPVPGGVRITANSAIGITN
jgi:uncharacterized repeat protein (TIGR02543 family)